MPWLGLTVLLGAILVTPGSAKADSDLTGVDEEVVTLVDRPDYHYEAPKGSNLTYLARRSLQLETSGSEVITGAPLVAAETCLVQALGADDLIYIGEPIVVGGQLIDDCLEQTSQLTEAQLECWAAYLPIRENLDWIEPTMVQAVAGVGDEAPGDLPSVGEVSDPETTASDTDPVSNNNGGSTFSNWYWWLIVGFIFGVGWYFMVLGRTWRSAPESSDIPEDDKKVSQPEDDSTSVKVDDSDSEESTNKKSKSRRRRSSKQK